MGGRQGTSLGEIRSILLGVGNKEEVLGWPFLPTVARAASGRLSSLCVLHVLVAFIGWKNGMQDT